MQTVVIVMMENRSFDHLLGYLGLPDSGHPNRARIDGIQNAQLFYAHDTYGPVPLVDHALDPDPPHEREDVAKQVADPLLGPMRGFVNSYRPTYEKGKAASPNPRLTGVMEYCRAKDIPTTDFLARNFAICDNWFAPLPASTLPNRLVAMSGYTLVDHTPDGYIAEIKNMFGNNPPDMVYDWLDARHIGWAIYHENTPFFKQMPSLLKRFEGDVGLENIFRPLSRLRDDALNQALPQVVFIEPTYQDDPWRGSAQATDDHAPASLDGGQRFLYRVYDALTANKAVTDGLVMILTYDEHGSFFDHVPPKRIDRKMPAGATYSPFLTTGVRVPAIIISPFVQPGALYEGLLDHTSILRFLGEKFSSDGLYSDLVNSLSRIGSVSAVLNDELLNTKTPARALPHP